MTIYDDLLCAVDKKKCVLMSLLNLGVASNTGKHSVMFTRLERSFGVTGKALEWVKSYFTDRYQLVSINGARSTLHPLPYGVSTSEISIWAL